MKISNRTALWLNCYKIKPTYQETLDIILWSNYYCIIQIIQ